MSQTLEQDSSSNVAMLSFCAADVTGTHQATASVQATLQVSSVTSSLVAEMGLPSVAPYALRDESTGAFLDDTRPIGDQIGPDAKVTVTPKTHLG